MRRSSSWTVAAAIFISLSVRGLPAGQPPPAASSKDALNVLAKMVEAMGGRKLLASIKDATLKGTAEMVQTGLSGPITIYQKEPNKLRMDLDLSSIAPGRIFTLAYDGTKGWGTDVRTWANEAMSEASSQDFSHQAVGNDSLLDPRKLGIVYVLKPRATLDGRDYIVLEQTLADGHKTLFYVDPETYLTYKFSTTSLDPATGAVVEIESVLGEYRRAGGLMINHSVRTYNGGTEIERLTITAVVHNSALNDALFILK